MLVNGSINITKMEKVVFSSFLNASLYYSKNYESMFETIFLCSLIFLALKAGH